MHEIDFTDVQERGWNIDPMFRAERDGQIFRGTATEIRNEIATFEQVAAENESV